MGGTQGRGGIAPVRIVLIIFSTLVALVAFASLCASTYLFFFGDLPNTPNTPDIPRKLLLAQLVVSCGVLLAILTLMLRLQAAQGERPASLTPALLFVALGVVLGAVSDWRVSLPGPPDAHAKQGLLEGGPDADAETATAAAAATPPN